MSSLFCAAWLAVSGAGSQADDFPKMLAYSAQPNPYFNDHAADIARIYDGFYFTIGSWDEGIAANIGIESGSGPDTAWEKQTQENLAHLRQAGVTENLLGISFGENDAWPSPETLLDPGFTEKLSRHFSALGLGAKRLGFRGVSIDVEYPYKRYSLDHEIYTYSGYTCEDLLQAAATQGRAVMAVLLDEFPESVVFTLPGGLDGRPIGRAFVLGMLEVMAERDAPGGFHLGSERAYSLYEGPVSQLTIARAGDGSAELLLSGKTLDYWKRRCTVAPGVWPLHMIETGGKDYPVRPWSEELAELRQQMMTLRAVAKRYLWSFSGKPIWYVHSPELEQKYGLRGQDFAQADEVIREWHEILADKRRTDDPRLKTLLQSIRQYDKGRIDFPELCCRFGTSPEWWILGPLGNPIKSPQFAQPDAALRPVRLNDAINGRDGLVRWFLWRNYEPLGTVSLVSAFGYRNTDNCSVHAVTTILSRRQVEAVLHMNWDDGAIVRVGDTIVLDRSAYPERGHGMLYRDRYLFEENVPVVIPRGETRLTVTSINSHGNWGFNIRITDKTGLPIEGLTFSAAACLE